MACRGRIEGAGGKIAQCVAWGRSNHGNSHGGLYLNYRGLLSSSISASFSTSISYNLMEGIAKGMGRVIAIEGPWAMAKGGYSLVRSHEKIS